MLTFTCINTIRQEYVNFIWDSVNLYEKPSSLFVYSDLVK